MSESQQLDFIEYNNNKVIMDMFNVSFEHNSCDNEYTLIIDCIVSPLVQQAIEAKAQDFLQYA